jgi:hypothetical protein
MLSKSSQADSSADCTPDFEDCLLRNKQHLVELLMNEYEKRWMLCFGLTQGGFLGVDRIYSLLQEVLGAIRMSTTARPNGLASRC